MSLMSPYKMNSGHNNYNKVSKAHRKPLTKPKSLAVPSIQLYSP